jgi:hypothetical protein
MYDFEDYGEQIREVDRALERECECLMERAGWLNGLKQLVKVMEDVVKENEELKQEKAELCQRLEELCKSSQPQGSVAFYNYGTYNEVQGGALNLIKKN